MRYKIPIIVCAVLLTTACASIQSAESILGVYTPTDKQCHGSAVQIDWCDKVSLLELVNGRFYSIAENEIAFVTWSGRYDLTYSAIKVSGKHLVDAYPFTLILSQESDYLEKIVFTAKNSATYHFGNPHQGVMSSMQLQLATDNALAHYIKSYPSDD